MTDRSEPSGGQRDSEGLRFLNSQNQLYASTQHHNSHRSWTCVRRTMHDCGWCCCLFTRVVFHTLFCNLWNFRLTLQVAMCACYCQNEFVSRAPKMNPTETQSSMGTAQIGCFWSGLVYWCTAEKTCCRNYERIGKMNKELIFLPPIW